MGQKGGKNLPLILCEICQGNGHQGYQVHSDRDGQRMLRLQSLVGLC